MDKYGVVTDESLIKTAMEGSAPCPTCGSRRVDRRSTVPHCPRCGTRPWENNASKRKEKGR